MSLPVASPLPAWSSELPRKAGMNLGGFLHSGWGAVVLMPSAARGGAEVWGHRNQICHVLDHSM